MTHTPQPHAPNPELDALISYIDSHTKRFPKNGLLPATRDTHFVNILTVNNPDAAELRTLVEAVKTGRFGDTLAPLDGKRHSSEKIAAWLGDQGHALDLMKLFTKLEMANVITPRKSGTALDKQDKHLVDMDTYFMQAEKKHDRVAEIPASGLGK